MVANGFSGDASTYELFVDLVAKGIFRGGLGEGRTANRQWKDNRLQAAYEEAVQRALPTFDSAAVGIGPVRKKYEGNLHKFFRKAFEVSYLRRNLIPYLELDG
ncbi:hypothetical protein L484_011780 [Morus notabilis]|uniref:Uncharacterized protein n=1 Tax=Morus notabilis TaxID=981085 RepID=W9SEB9_9ROSA|nr:hypothetical protein L484_011780 [Morus notabilis]